jgi:DNA-binding response OmpR family regulator/two-component sensor histidine kinase
MLRLVNQILEFRKIQQSKLKVQEINAVTSITNICSHFHEFAQKNNIQFDFINHVNQATIWVSADFLNTVLMNLLSNAFKYTPEDKAICVTLSNSDTHLFLEVTDEGCGMTKEQQKEIFVRFTSFNQDSSKPSTGIGLSIVKDIVEKHHAEIRLESEPGKGSTFVVSIQKGYGHYSKEVEILKTDLSRDTPLLFDETDTEKVKATEKPKILIVEDNEELKSFIKGILDENYIVLEASNGCEGLEKAIQFVPDFIISDIMMPLMNGIDMLQQLKKNINTSHIPVILLTAKTAIESKLEGLTYGADDYITKPFSVQYFLARIDNILNQRKRIHKAFRAQLESSDKLILDIPTLSISSHDEELLNKVIQIIDEQMDNGEFTIEDVCRIIGMSRSGFFNKFKALTGLSPFDFIRDLKMKRAAQLLANGEYRVKEVSSMIGISDTKYFGKVFKQKYGLNPHEYKNNMHPGSTKTYLP